VLTNPVQLSAVAVPAAVLRVLTAREPGRWPVFLESAAHGPLGRYSMLVFQPRASLTRDAHGRLEAKGTSLVPGGFLDNLAAWYARDAAPGGLPDKQLPFTGGWVVYLGYEIAEEIEPSLDLPIARTPYSAFALRVEHLVVHDQATDTVYAVSAVDDPVVHQHMIAQLQAAASQGAPEDPSPVPGLRTLRRHDHTVVLAGTLDAHRRP
jgi:anthranilate synthase component 1